MLHVSTKTFEAEMCWKPQVKVLTVIIFNFTENIFFFWLVVLSCKAWQLYVALLLILLPHAALLCCVMTCNHSTSCHKTAALLQTQRLKDLEVG